MNSLPTPRTPAEKPLSELERREQEITAHKNAGFFVAAIVQTPVPHIREGVRRVASGIFTDYKQELPLTEDQQQVDVEAGRVRAELVDQYGQDNVAAVPPTREVAEAHGQELRLGLVALMIRVPENPPK